MRAPAHAHQAGPVSRRPACSRERGYDATTLRDIARRATIPVGSLHYHFPAKDELFAAVYEESIARVARHVKEAIDTVRHPWETTKSRQISSGPCGCPLARAAASFDKNATRA
jgi:AcrR family transcriptional regulator